MLGEYRSSALLTAFILLLTSMSIPPMASADHDSLKVIVMVEDRQFTDKDVANFSVLVFNKGVLTDPDAPPGVTVWGSYRDHIIPVTRMATGIYNGTVDIAATGVLFGDVYIKANATLGKTGAGATVYNEAEGFGLIVMRGNTTTGFRVHPYLKAISDGLVRPGTNLTFGIRWTYDGKPVDASGQRYSTEYIPGGSSESTNKMSLQATRIAAGEYECKYTVPDVRSSGLIEFRTGGSSNGQEKDVLYWLSVDFFSVVCHNISRTDNDTWFELYIGDPSGAPVVGATVELNYNVDSQRIEDQPIVSGKTNSTGVASMSIRFPTDSCRIYLYGYANASGKSQFFDNDIILSNAPKHIGEYRDEFEVDVTGGFNAPPAGQVMYRDCYAYNNASIWANQTVYCFVLTGFFEPNGHLRQSTHVEEYTCTTDANGKMTLPVKVPAWTNWQLDFDFMSATGIHPKPGQNFSDHDSLDGLNYSSQGTSMGFETPSMLLCETLDMQRGDLSLGAPVSVVGKASGQDYPVGEIGWDFGDSPEMSEWKVLVQIWRYMPMKGAKYCGTAVLPSFLPAGLNYSIYGYADNDVFGWQYDETSIMSNQTIFPPSSPPDKKKGYSTYLDNGVCLATGMFIVLVPLGVAFILWYVRRKTMPPEIRL